MLAYNLAVIEQLTDGLAKVFTSSYPDVLLRAPFVGPAFPFLEEDFPSIIVSFAPTSTRNMGLGHYLTLIDEETGEGIRVGHWRFMGQVSFKIVALTTIDRAAIVDQMTGILAFGKHDTRFLPFWEAVLDDTFISMTLLAEIVTPGGEMQQPVPWGNVDAFIYESTLTCAIVGEFFSDTFDGNLVRVSGVNILPYRSDQTPPAGTGDPNQWI